MGTRIATNVDSLRGLRSLNKANDLQSQTLARLSTGTQINSGKDNPSGLIGSETLRAQVTSIEQSIKNSNRANNVIGTADGALGEVNNLLDQIRGLVQEGVNSGALSQTEIEANQSQIDAALSAINRIAANTSFAGDKLIDGSKAFTTLLTSTDSAKLSDYQINEALFGTSATIDIDATIDTAATKGSLYYTGDAHALSSATTLEVSGSKGSQVLFFGSGSTKTNIQNAINNVSDVTGVSASFSTAAVANEIRIDGADDTASTSLSYVLSTSLTGANNDLAFTSLLSDNSTPVRVTYADPGANNAALSVSVSGNDITVNLATNGTGTITSTAAQVKAAIEASSPASALVTVAHKPLNDGTGVVTALAQTALTGGNNDLTFTSAITDHTTPVRVRYVDPAAVNGALSVSVSGNDVTVNLATNSTGTITSTAAQVKAAIEASTAASALVTVANKTGNNGSGVVTARGYLTLSGGDNDITFADVRQDAGASDAVKVAYAVSGNNTALSVAVVDNAGTKEITFSLATDGSGNATTTAAQLETFLTSSTSAGAIAARAIISADVTEGSGGDVLAAQSLTSLTGGTDAVLELSSDDYGSKQFVAINVLNGSFDTQNSDDVDSSREIGTDIVATINGQRAFGDGLKASISTALLSASVNFTSAANVDDNSASITVTGGGSLFQIGENVSTGGQIGVGIEAVNTARLGGVAGKLYELGSGAGKSLLDVGPSVQGSTLVDIINQARDRVNTLRARLGALQKNVIETNISSLGVALENISDARSNIADTDFAVETAKLTKSQILAQAGISALQIANSAPQQVLSLLRG